jgi:hypothetical protein
MPRKKLKKTRKYRKRKKIKKNIGKGSGTSKYNPNYTEEEIKQMEIRNIYSQIYDDILMNYNKYENGGPMKKKWGISIIKINLSTLQQKAWEEAKKLQKLPLAKEANTGTGRKKTKRRRKKTKKRK